MPKRKALSDTMTADRWAALYESAAERASKGEREIKRMQERIRQLEQQVEDWKARAKLNRSALDALRDSDKPIP